MGRKRHHNPKTEEKEELKKVKEIIKRDSEKTKTKPKEEPKKEKKVSEKEIEILKPKKEITEQPKKESKVLDTPQDPKLPEEPKPVNECKKGTKICGIIMLLSSIILLVSGLILIVHTTRSPKAIYTKAINQLFDDIDKCGKYFDKYYIDIKNQPLEAEGNFKLSTNIEDVVSEIGNEVKDLEISGKVGFDYNEKNLQLEGTVHGDTEEISAAAFLVGRKTYLETNFYKLMNITEDSDLYDEFKYFIDDIDDVDFNFDYKDYLYISKTIKRALINSLDPEAIEKEKTTFDVLDKEIKGTKYTYTIDEKTMSKMLKSISSDLLKNKDFLSKLSKLTGVDKDEIVEGLKELKEEAKDINFKEKYKLNIYTRGFFNDISGIELYLSKDAKMGLYTDGKNYDFRYVESGDKISITAEKEDEEYAVSGRYNSKTFLKATVKKFLSEEIDVDFEINNEDEEEIKGTITLKASKEKEKYKYDVRYKLEYNYFDADIEENVDEYVDIDGSYTVEKVKELKEKDTKGAIDIEDASEKEFFTNLKEIVDKDKKLKELFGEAIDEYIKGLDRYGDEDMNLIDIADSYAIHFLNKKESVNIADLEDIDLIASVIDPFGHTEYIANKRTVCFKEEGYSNSDLEEELDTKRCITIDPEGSEGYIVGQTGLNFGYSLDEILAIVEKRYGRKIDITKLKPSGKKADGRDYYNSKRREYEISFYEYQGKTYVYKIFEEPDYIVDIYKVINITNEGNIYHVTYECEDENEETYQFVLTFEKLTDTDVRELEIDEVRLIGLNIV